MILAIKQCTGLRIAFYYKSSNTTSLIATAKTVNFQLINWLAGYVAGETALYCLCKQYGLKNKVNKVENNMLIAKKNHNFIFYSLYGNFRYHPS